MCAHNSFLLLQQLLEEKKLWLSTDAAAGGKFVGTEREVVQKDVLPSKAARQKLYPEETEVRKTNMQSSNYL